MDEQTILDAVLGETRRLLAEYQAECAGRKAVSMFLTDVSTMETGLALLNAPQPIRVAALNAILVRLRQDGLFPIKDDLSVLGGRFLRRLFPNRGANEVEDIALIALPSGSGLVPLLAALLTEPLFNHHKEAALLLQAVEGTDTNLVERSRGQYGSHLWEVAHLLDAALLQLLQLASDHEGGFPEVLALLKRLLPTYLAQPGESSSGRRLRAQAEVVLGMRMEEPPLVKAKPWGAEALADLAKMPMPERKNWETLLRCAGAACLETPSEARLERLREHYKTVRESAG